MPGTELSTAAKEVTKMLFLPPVSFLSGVEDNQEMPRIQGAELADVGELRGFSKQEGWSGLGG